MPTRQPAGPLTIEVGEYQLPARYAVCPRCSGSGTQDHPAFANGITSSEWNDEDNWDEDSRHAYMSGAYDVECSSCKGQRVVLVADVQRCTFAQKRVLVEQRQNARYEAEDRRADRMTRFYESGGYA